MLKKYYLGGFFWAPKPSKRYQNMSGLASTPLPPYLLEGWDVLKIIEEDQDFLVKMGGSPYSGGRREGSRGAYRKGGNHCFSLVMYGFCSSNALYSASHSLRMFIINSD